MAKKNRPDQDIIDVEAQARRSKSLAEIVLDRQSALEGDPERQNFVSRVQDVITYCRDDLDKYAESDPGSGRGHRAGEFQMTSRVMSDLEDAADSFCGNVFVPQGWFGYAMADQRLQREDAIQAWLQRLETHFESVYSNANFYPQMPNIAMDSLSIGDGAAFIAEDEAEDRPYVNYWEMLNTWFVRDRWGNIIAVHHRWSFNALDAYTRWGTKCGKNVVQSAEGNSPADRSTFIQAIYRIDDPVIKGFRFERPRKFIEVWVQEGSEKNSKNYTPAVGDGSMNGILEQGGYTSMPVADWPYWWKSAETYGRGPMHLVSIIRLHAMWRSAMLGAERNAAPSLLAQTALMNQLDLSPDGVTWVDNPDAAVRSVYGGGVRLAEASELIDRMERELKDMLKLNVFLAMTLKTKDMRVDEVMQVIGEQAAMMAPRIGLMNSVFLDNVHARMWSIEEQRGRLMSTDPPGIILQYMKFAQREAQMQGRKWRGLPIRVVYKGPMQLAQDSYFVQRRVAAGLAPIMTYLQPMDPEAVADAIDVPVAVEEILDKTGFMQTAVRSKEERIARQKARAEAQAGLIEAQTAQGGARALKDVATAAQTVSQGQQV